MPAGILCAKENKRYKKSGCAKKCANISISSDATVMNAWGYES